MKILCKQSPHEVQSGFTRLAHAEGLIVQMPETHDGRNTWLLNYGVTDTAKHLRVQYAKRHNCKFKYCILTETFKAIANV